MATISIPHIPADLNELPIERQFSRARPAPTDRITDQARAKRQLVVESMLANRGESFHSTTATIQPRTNHRPNERSSTKTSTTSLVSNQGLFAANPKSDQAIETLSNLLLERFPLASPTIILFVGTQLNPQTSATCASVANVLAQRRVGEILLVDSSAARELTFCYQASEQKGLSNLLAYHDHWKSTLVKLPTSGLDFLPAGTSHWDHWGAEHHLRRLAGELKRHYQFICVTADDPQHSNTKIWTSICDGSFLLVSLKNAHQAIAESAVVELQSSGARLLGCVVTEADTPRP